MSFYINGIFDSTTLLTIKALGINKIGLDLRPRSENLITYTELKKLQPLLTDFEASLIFESDAKSNIDSFLDLMGEQRKSFSLQFRDQRPAEFYHRFSNPIEWMFHPDGNWREIFLLNNLKTLLLPLDWKEYYQNNPSFWHLIDERKIQVHLYASSVKQAKSLELSQNLSLALDLNADFRDAYRVINQDKLKKIREWKRANENLTGQ